MSPERRHLLRRLVTGGITLGILAALLCGLAESALIFAGTSAPLESTGERVGFTLALLGLLALAGAVLGALEGLAATLALSVSQRAAQVRRRRHLEARIYTFLLAPGVTVAVAQLWSGRRARLIPGHHAIVVALIAAVLLGIYGAFRLMQGWLERCSQPARRPRILVASVALALTALGFACLVADRVIFARLYAPLHVTLELAAFTLVQLALGVVYLRLLERQERWVGWLVRPAVVWSLLVATLAFGALALGRYQRNESLRGATFRSLGASARLLAVSESLRLLRVTTEPPTPVATASLQPVSPLPAGPRFPGADVFLISIDALRADRLTARTTPRLSALAASSIVFDQAYTPIPHTSFAIASLLTGKYVSSLAALGQDPAQHETLAQIFIRNHYKTAAFFPPSVFYIDHQRFAETEKVGYHFEYVKYEYMGAHGRTDQVRDFLEEERPERVFVWAHYFDPHEPYDLHEGISVDGRPPRSALERYDGEVQFVDREVGRLIDIIRRLRPQAIVVITADHGEEFGEHGGRYHGTALYEEQTHVPLIIHAPGLAPRRVRHPVNLVDLAPTLLNLVDILPSARMRGQDLGPWLAGDPPAARLPPVFSEMGAKKMVALGGDRLICDLTHSFCELYDLARDPGQLHDLAGREPERQQAARALLDQWLAGQSTFEREHDAAQEDARLILERGRQRDARVAPDVARLLLSPIAELRAQAAAVLLRLPVDPSTSATVAAARQALAAKGEADFRLDVAAYRLGDTALADRVAEPLASATAQATAASWDGNLLAHAGLALAERGDPRGPRLLLLALERCSDEGLETRVIDALGAWPQGDRSIMTALLGHLDGVRTRVATVRAIGQRRDPAAAPHLARLIVEEPYVTVRAEMARVLGLLGNPAAVRPLRRLAGREPEAVVRREIVAALARLERKRPGATADR